ncbi:MerR family transcriptional regulator [Actinoplanes flavus]|uniref:MerR family transcriptional regulator n=1 Tax=Actinoplanes flavus TaxID=2820290 RepID=A0ABS3UWK2_9ACTN|nr:MerR family transcriptional regulator [Actinoplanes flavus]MBO3742965.1 MerR family transcriptional regulator [Actinoplanes flavus]
MAGRFGLGPHVLRHWEEQGLLSPDRLPNGRRRYTSRDVLAVRLILLARSLGFSHAQMRTLVCGSSDRATQRAVVAGHRAALKRRIAELSTLLPVLTHGMECTADAIPDCPHVAALLPPDERSHPSDHRTSSASATIDDLAQRDFSITFTETWISSTESPHEGR